MNKKQVLYNIKYLFYIIGCIAVSIIYMFITSYILYLCDFRGADDGIRTLLFMITITFLPPIFWNYFILKRIYNIRKANNKVYIKVWSLSNFILEHNYTMQVGKFQKIFGKSYYQCIFTKDNDTNIFVKFSPKIGYLSPDEIEKRKEELIIGITLSKKYYLDTCNEDFSSWMSIDIK